MADSKRIFFFGGGKAEGMVVAPDEKGRKKILGGKGSGLADMTNAGLPVPPGFTITCQTCAEYNALGKKWPAGLEKDVRDNMVRLEKLIGKQFGGDKDPLLVSVRSGAAVSMPGMMDTVLNLGLNPASLDAVVKLTGNQRFAWDAYRRFMQMFGDVVMGVPHSEFEHVLESVKHKYGKKTDPELTATELEEVVAGYKEVYKRHTGQEFPTDPYDQLKKAIDAVFGSWDNPRAVKYREINDIKGLDGTAVNVQTMVFGNMGNDSGTGVAFTRNPSTGENKFYGEFLMNAQGEDVVAGIRTPESIEKLREHDTKAYEQLVDIRGKLEKYYRDMQDIEFTIEKGKLYMLQTRSGKRTASAAVKVAVDMVKEGLISKDEALLRVDPNALNQLLHPVFDPKTLASAQSVAKGLPASPGAATGQVVFNAEDAEAWAKDGKKVILVRIETSPEDVGGMNVAQGILTARGGMTSHAAVVGRGMGKCCVVGAGDILISYEKKEFNAHGTIVKEGAWISLDGSAGKVYIGKLPTTMPNLSGDFGILMGWADETRRLGVRANADIPRDAEAAVRFGAEGIGLCRTEHMFFAPDRIVSFRRLILVAEEVKNLRDALKNAEGEAEKQLEAKLEAPLAQYHQALAELLPHQRSDFEGLFRALQGKPCTIRTLDPPLHEFLPQDEAGQQEMAQTMGVSIEKIKEAVEALHEFNPMLGHRGCRLGITYPEVTAMQIRAIIEAAFNVHNSGIKVEPEIMIPLVGHVKELILQKQLTLETMQEVLAEKKLKEFPFHVKIGTMIEVPRGAITADEIAKEAEFFSFGTNDLTQMGCGFSRDDAGKFLGEYVKLGIYDYDPFTVLDQEGVGKLVAMACELGRKTRPNIKLGICGEHGGEPKTVEFCHKVGLTYVSCSPYRVPIARLAAAHAVVKERMAAAKAAKTTPAAPKAVPAAPKAKPVPVAPKAAPKPAKKIAPVPVKKVAPKPAKKTAPVPVKKAAPKPVKKTAPKPMKKLVKKAAKKPVKKAPKKVAVKKAAKKGKKK
jgi:pyruvate,orthophosphate dikinase